MEATMNRLRFSGKVAIVTGAARGMGKATALTLAREGATVVINDLRRDAAEAVVDENEVSPGKMAVYIADVTDEAQVEAMVSWTVEQYGTVDILVNNAGILRTTTPLETISVQEWTLMMTVNVTGVFLCTRAVLPLMKKQRSGKIVNISSSAGRSTSTFGGAHYTTSKAAVLGLTRHTAREATPYQINVNAVAPGSMDTEMIRELATPEHIAREGKGVPLGRLGTPQDTADLVAFLCSAEAAYISGATIDLNGADLIL
jgi:3-oxoacyl-[acyl-carrier protein] reductase